jgi:Xaa-Pro aminopeptidase
MAVTTGVSERVERLRESLEEPLLVTYGINVQYLTGFKSSNAALFVDEDRVLLFTDFRYAEAARAIDGVDFIQAQRVLLKTVAQTLEGTVAFEETSLPYAGWQTLRESGLELVPRAGLVERLRAVKDDGELAKLREAARITDDVYAAFAEEKFVGRTERDLAWTMEQLYHEHGAHALAFELIVGSGPTGAKPHGRPTDRVVEANTTVVIDSGCSVGDYVSDCTRTFATGELPDDLAEAYEVTQRAQLEGLAAMRAGTTGAEADSAARKVIEAAGLGEKFGHGLGHGVGMAVHEAPTARPESADVLEPGNVISVEPGVYLEGRGGVRIEDLVVIANGAPENLYSYTKELVAVR